MLGIPRGGIIVTAEIARLLGAELDVVFSRKLSAPGNPELAIGSIGENGKLFINEDLAFRLGADKAYIEAEKIRQLKEIENRAKLCRQIKAKVSLKGKIVIVTDDGVATGATMQSALWSIRQEKPKRLIAAIPVGAEEAVGLLADYAHEVLILRVPDFLGAISQFYDHFDQTSEKEVLGALKEAVRIKGNSDEK